MTAALRDAMPASADAAPSRIDRRWLGGAVVLVLACVLLEARPDLPRWSGSAEASASALVLLFAALLVVGAVWPLPDATVADGAASRWKPREARTLAVVAAGLLPFALGRVIGGGRPPVPVGSFVVVTNILAALAEEALFRRLCFGLLQPAGTAWAVVGSAVLFAAVHATTYGWWVLPLDLAAGLVLGWQRAVTGSWFAPGVTHVVVNLLVVL
jgi:membrane protease YdiL (CAAX protease family)